MDESALSEGSIFANKIEKSNHSKKSSYDAFDAITKAVVKHCAKKYSLSGRDKGLHTVRRRSAKDLLILCHTEDKSTFGLKNCNCSFHVHAKLFNDNVTETLNEGDLGDASDEDHEIEVKKGGRIASAKIWKICLEHSCLKSGGESEANASSHFVNNNSRGSTVAPQLSLQTFAFQNMHKIISSLYFRQDCVAFRDPVDWKYLGLLDYPDVVKHPMDLGTVIKRIESDAYSSREEIASDVRLVWSNCKTYNREGSEFYFLADKFSKDFEAAYTALVKFEDSQNDANRIPSLQEKMQLTYEVFRLSNAEMAEVLSMVEKECAAAISRSMIAEEIMLNVDGLSPRCFHSVNAFVQDALLAQFSNKAAKSKKRGGPPLMPVPRQLPQQKTNSSNSASRQDNSGEIFEIDTANCAEAKYFTTVNY